MKLSRLLAAGAMAGVVIGAVLLAMDAVTPRMTLARERGPSLEAGDATGPTAPDALLAQADSGGDQRLPVQLWTVLAAGGAAGVGLVLFLVRVALGRVKPPPQQEEVHH